MTHKVDSPEIFMHLECIFVVFWVQNYDKNMIEFVCKEEFKLGVTLNYSPSIFQAIAINFVGSAASILITENRIKLKVSLVTMLELEVEQYREWLQHGVVRRQNNTEDEQPPNYEIFSIFDLSQISLNSNH